MARLNHPNIVRHIKSFEADDVLYIVMEYCTNRNLGKYLEE